MDRSVHNTSGCVCMCGTVLQRLMQDVCVCAVCFGINDYPHKLQTSV